MNVERADVGMREDMNPLDLLAEVAVSCSDNPHDEKLQHCDAFVEPEAEFNKPEAEISKLTESSRSVKLPNVNITNNNTIINTDSQPADEAVGPRTAVTTHVEDIIKNQAENVQRSSLIIPKSINSEIQSANTATAIVNTEMTENVNRCSQTHPLVTNSSTCLYVVTPDYYGGAHMRILSDDHKDSGHSLPRTGQGSIMDESSDSALVRGAKDCGAGGSSNVVPVTEHENPSKRSLCRITSAPTLSQRVTRLLAPNFKLTMTDTIPQVLQNRKVSSLLLGNMGSAAMRNALLPTTSVRSRLVPIKQQAAVRKYPNITMSIIPTDYPLLDHDYCYQNYCDIVQAAARLLKQQAAEKKAAAKLAAVKLAESSEEGKTGKRKYRTKKIIAEECENARRAALKQKANDGDTQAQLELSTIEEQVQKGCLEKEIRPKKKIPKKKQEASTVVEIDSEEEAMLEFAGDIDDSNPVLDHDPSFQDQFIYFGSKKHKSKRRNAKREDPYESFWKTGMLNAGQPGARSQTMESVVSGGSSGPSSALPVDVRLNTNQEINDVLDVLGISTEARGQLLEVNAANNATGPTDKQLTDTDTVTTLDTDTSVALISHINNDRCAQNSPAGSIIATSHHCSPNVEMFSENVDDVGQVLHCEEIVACNPTADDGLGDLLQGITMDQVSELILALEVEPRLGVKSGETATVKTTEQIKATSSSTDIEIKTLSALTKDVCEANNIEIPAELLSLQSEFQLESNVETPTLSQQSQTSNISLDITEADLLTSDKNLNLDILNDLSATPPKSSSRPTSLFQTPTSMTMSPSALMNSPKTVLQDSPSAKPDEPSTLCPVVVPVTMYWNTFPALLLDGVKYVRLIDISRQALPSKETGLLKKRAQTLGYEVTTCTDLQRNLLVRYAFANPSRSNLMVCEAGAAEVIASYMEKSEMEQLSKAPDLPSQQLPADVTSVTTTTVRAPAEPITLMPQVLIEHKPLQQSSSTNGKKTPTTAQQEPVAPERSSRLRQIKSSYRRFLSLGSAVSTPSTTKAADTAIVAPGVVEENASDRGYHSDQSPDSLIDKPIKAKKHKNTSKSKPPSSSSAAAGKKYKSARRSLSASQALMPSTPLVEETDDIPKVLPGSVISLAAASEAPAETFADAPTVVTTDMEIMISSPRSPTDISNTQQDDVHLDKTQVEKPVPEPLLNVETKSEIVLIRHTDLVQRRNGTLQRSQDGELYIHFFKSLHSPCIECCTCRQFYSLKAFTKHQHHNRRVIPVKVRQRMEARGLSIDSESWQTFKKQKKIYEGVRKPLKKLNETKLSETPSTFRPDLICGPPELGKRIPKQKKFNPDEVYYINPCIMNATARKRKAEIDLNLDRKRNLSSNVLNIKNLIDR